MKKIISAALLTLAVGGASAQAYVGGSFGLAKVALDCTGASSCDDTDTGYKAYVGYTDPAWKHFSVEAGYIDFGKARASDPSLSLEIKAKALFLAAALRGDFTANFGGSARLGFANVKTTCRATLGSLAGEVSETSVTALFGVGLDYAFTKNLKAVASADFSQGECAGDSGTVSLLSIGAQYNF